MAGFLVTPAAAESTFLFSPQPATENFFGFGGLVLERLEMPSGFEPNHTLLGAGYQRFWGDTDGLLYGLEAGLAARFSDNFSLEAWGGTVARYNFHFNKVTIAPAFTFGLSAVTQPMSGGEQRREDLFENGDARFLLAQRSV